MTEQENLELHVKGTMNGTQSTDRVAGWKEAILNNLCYTQGKPISLATQNDWYMAVAYTVREKMMKNWVAWLEKGHDNVAQIVGYLSAEFLMGPHLGNAMINLGILDELKAAIIELGQDFDQLINQEQEPGLGNGGLGRLAACYLDSLSTLKVPALGYGIRYEFGIFDQEIKDGWQVESTDKWLLLGNPWEIARPELSYTVKLEGYTENYTDEGGQQRVRWVPGYEVKGVAYDTPIPGYKNNAINLLRLWKSEAVESFDFDAFNRGDYIGAVNQKIFSETISKVLYPNDESEKGKRLRLTQQFFFVSCSLQDVLRLHTIRGLPLEKLPHFMPLQLNDTHPAIAVAELMRLLVDEYHLPFDMAWNITSNTLSYTNHTLLPEALEKWSLPLFAKLLPRHLQLIFDINDLFIKELRETHNASDDLVRRLSIIDEDGGRFIRMAHLACVGGHAINGVSVLHSELLKQDVLKDFYALYPSKFYNVTNGVTPRRWMKLYNPKMSDLITESIGEGWVNKLDTELIKLEKFAYDKSFQDTWRRIKYENKVDLARLIQERTGTMVDPHSLFDVQVKRIHLYKRQHLNALHVISLYNRIKKNPGIDIVPRTVIFGGKAAPGYFLAKLIIKLINSIAEKVNHDPDVNGRLKVVFFPDFNVKNSEYVYRAAELSEQISTAGKEASGTGNMKFALNGALTIGTLDGANVEMREAVGSENFFLFGLETHQVYELRKNGYNPYQTYMDNPELKETIDTIRSGAFSNGDNSLYNPLLDTLLSYDPFMVLADYQSYVTSQQQVSDTFSDKANWNQMSILNVARMGMFSSDRSIREYCEHIWQVKSIG